MPQFFKKKTFLILLPVLLLAVFCFAPIAKAAPAQLIYGGIQLGWESIKFAFDTGGRIAAAFFGMFFQTILLIISLILTIATFLLNWVLGNPTELSFTNPTGNAAIQIGWTLLRDLTNMLFVLGLAYIGLATALNFLNFDTKKIFPKLILIALLINFTPVICGVVVDISNILADFFLNGADFTTLLNRYTIQQEGWAAVAEFAQPATLIKTIILIGYGLLSSVILFLFAGLFILRYPMIWILVILSPLAFFSWIFPQTKKYFTQWWELFLQWSFVIVPASFFLYLSRQILAKGEYFTPINVPGGFLGIGALFSELAPVFIAALFLCIGFVVTLTISAKGAKVAIAAGMAGIGVAAWGAGKLSAKGAKGLWAKRKEIGGAAKHPIKTGKAIPEKIREGWGKAARAVAEAAKGKAGLSYTQRRDAYRDKLGIGEKDVKGAQTIKRNAAIIGAGAMGAGAVGWKATKAAGRGAKAALWQTKVGEKLNKKTGKMEPVYKKTLIRSMCSEGYKQLKGKGAGKFIGITTGIIKPRKDELKEAIEKAGYKLEEEEGDGKKWWEKMGGKEEEKKEEEKE